MERFVVMPISLAAANYLHMAANTSLAHFTRSLSTSAERVRPHKSRQTPPNKSSLRRPHLRVDQTRSLSRYRLAESRLQGNRSRRYEASAQSAAASALLPYPLVPLNGG